jgi:hypothetical protein
MNKRLVLTNIAHHAHVPLKREKDMIALLEDLKKLCHCYKKYDKKLISNSNAASSPFLFKQSVSEKIANNEQGSNDSSSNALLLKKNHFIYTREWIEFANWTGKSCDEIIKKLNPYGIAVNYCEEDFEDEEEKRNRNYKKRFF